MTCDIHKNEFKENNDFHNHAIVTVRKKTYLARLKSLPLPLESCCRPLTDLKTKQTERETANY